MMKRIKNYFLRLVSCSVVDSDKGKCTKCKFNGGDYCFAGTYYANRGMNKRCYEGELWEKETDS